MGWDGPGGGIDSRVTSLRKRLPHDLADSTAIDASTGRFASLYVTDDEAALEMANRTMHGVLHLGWVPEDAGGCPIMLRNIGRAWRCERR